SRGRRPRCRRVAASRGRTRRSSISPWTRSASASANSRRRRRRGRGRSRLRRRRTCGRRRRDGDAVVGRGRRPPVRRLTAVRVGLGVAVLFALLRLADPRLLALLDLKALDLRYGLRGATAPGPEVVIVALDEASLAELGRWPWPRGR